MRGTVPGLLGLSVDQSRSAVVFLEPGTAEAVYEQIVPSRRIALHRKAAEAVQSEGEQLGHRVAATPAADETLAVELEEFARRQATAGRGRMPPPRCSPPRGCPLISAPATSGS
jgi:hypothetical protein